MSCPRQVLPESFLFITRSCTQRQYLLRPDDATNNNLLYCLGCALQKFDMQLLMFSFESNHEHLVVYDRLGRYPEFTEYLHTLIARSQNALRGRWQNLWSAEETCVVRLINREDIIAKMIYTAANPVKDRLVERVHQWPGANGYVNLLHARPFTATRPTHFFRTTGPTPDSVTFELTIPDALGPAAAVIAEVRAGVKAIEDALSAEIRNGARIVGRKNVLAQPWQGSPTTPAPHRNLRPRIAALDPIARRDALIELLTFQAAYRAARKKWLEKTDAVFPAGTYWLHRFAGVPVEG